MKKEGVIKSFPLSWPLHKRKTQFRIDSRFEQNPSDTLDYLKAELNRIGATNIIISSNAAVKDNGDMYADAMGRHHDPAVAVYFKWKGKEMVICADQYCRIWENVYAIGKTIKAMRDIDRYGVSDFMESAFTGFTAIPESVSTPYKRSWWEVLEVSKMATDDEIKIAFRNLSKKYHPDKGGDDNKEKFQELSIAYKEAQNR